MPPRKGVHFAHNDDEIVVRSERMHTPELSPTVSPSASEASLPPSDDGTLVYHQSGLSSFMLDAQKKKWNVYDEHEEGDWEDECATGDEYVEQVEVKIDGCRWLQDTFPISTGKNGKLTIGRFYSTLYEQLHQHADSTLATLPPADQSKVLAASKNRCAMQGKKTNDGVRNVDYLLERHILKAIYAVPGRNSWTLEFTSA